MGSLEKNMPYIRRQTINSLRTALVNQGDKSLDAKELKQHKESLRKTYVVRYNKNGDLFLIRKKCKRGFTVWFVHIDSIGKVHLNPIPEWHATYVKFQKQYDK